MRSYNGLHCEWTVRALEAGKHCALRETVGLFQQQSSSRCLLSLTLASVVDGRVHVPSSSRNGRSEGRGRGRTKLPSRERAGYGRPNDKSRYWWCWLGGALMESADCVNFMRFLATPNRRASKPKRVSTIKPAWNFTLAARVRFETGFRLPSCLQHGKLNHP